MLNHDMDYVVSLKIPPKKLPIRMWYMYKNKPCALIDVDEAKKIVRIKIMWIMCITPCITHFKGTLRFTFVDSYPHLSPIRIYRV